MRLARLEHGHRLKHKWKLAKVRLFGGRKPPDVMKTLLYRPEHFGAPFSNLLQKVMRGDSSWTVAERELFASFSSRLNECTF